MLNIEKKTIKYKAIIISAFTLKNLKIKIGKNEIKKYIINVLFKLNFFNKMWCKWLLSAEKGSFLFMSLSVNNLNISIPGTMKSKHNSSTKIVFEFIS